MFKRSRWFVTGAGIGATGAVWAQRLLRRQVDKLAPDNVANRVATQVKGAVSDGRTAMKERESELRSDRRP